MELTYGYILAVTAGITQFIKTKLNLVDTAAEILSALVGIVLGSGYQYGITNPVDFNGWFSVGLVGIATWLTTAGLYKLTSSVAEKFSSK